MSNALPILEALAVLAVIVAGTFAARAVHPRVHDRAAAPPWPADRVRRWPGGTGHDDPAPAAAEPQPRDITAFDGGAVTVGPPARSHTKVTPREAP